MTRAAVLQLFHEANAFSPLRVTRQEFLNRHHMSGEAVRAAFGDTRNWMGGVLTTLETAGVETETGLCTAALPGGPLDADSWRVLRREVLESLDDILTRGKLDYVFLLLHGALVVDSESDPEGDLVGAVRRRIGPKTHLSVPLDFHANVGPGIIAGANLVLGGKLYPHTDTYERGARLVRLALTEPGLSTHYLPLGFQVQMPRQETTGGAFAELAALTDRLEAETEAADVTLLGGFPFSTAPYAGTSALVTCGEEDTVAQVEARLHAAIAKRRASLEQPVPDIADAMMEVQSRLHSGRIVLTDIGDNPGGGGLGDRTHLLASLVNLDRPFAFGALVCPELVERATSAGVGGGLDIETPNGSLPARVATLREVRYRNHGAMMTGEELFGGPGAVLEAGRGRILVTTHRIQAYDTEAFASMGIDLSEMDVIAVKSIGHFRASYTPLATGGIVLTDSGGFSSPAYASRASNAEAHR